MAPQKNAPKRRKPRKPRRVVRTAVPSHDAAEYVTKRLAALGKSGAPVSIIVRAVPGVPWANGSSWLSVVAEVPAARARAARHALRFCGRGGESGGEGGI